MRKLDYTTIFFAIMGSFLFLFILVPIANLMISADPSSILNNLQDKEVMSAIFISVYCALAATLIAVIFGVPLAYILARHDFAGKGFVEAVIDVPIVIPHTISGIALLLIFTSTGVIGAPLGQLGLVFTDAIPGIVVAMLFASASFVVNSAREGFESVDPRMEKVARTLGSGSFKTFFIITLPLAVRSIVVGSIMCWARAISEFGAIIIIAYFPTTAPVLIYRRFVDFGLSESTPVAVILISLCLLLFLVVRLIMKGWRTYDKN
ncbi:MULTISPECIES: tungstate ABC transporter permease WtpB [Methanobacterium]|jgi:molybdate/tungstate transport system permease protein|uniref:Molybdate/tungstate transport system permease protein WtpB n=1 Tax=Methanobacterium formicicum TaxID=2162 RepID=A0A090JWC7_METFO|nr:MULTISPECIES: tungstate ABC transporter permease WtpB [Methanobacterium]MDG3546888.1 tungstate ABC transporter permease WtpB [Methanobacterium formicicum]MDH2660563.1 tungstate ABC transporter permease WtpB [Methanobacterium formicicum]CEA13836.1 Molybdate/tungstate transport system permease protein WtpB [Methanobacterium formicicum]CEL23807.1 Molybdate/tungstate transport system permease protein WtpB [Methanobacterium formicicum]